MGGAVFGSVVSALKYGRSGRIQTPDHVVRSQVFFPRVFRRTMPIILQRCPILLFYFRPVLPSIGLIRYFLSDTIQLYNFQYPLPAGYIASVDADSERTDPNQDKSKQYKHERPTQRI